MKEDEVIIIHNEVRYSRESKLLNGDRRLKSFLWFSLYPEDFSVIRDKSYLITNWYDVGTKVSQKFGFYVQKR